MQKMETTEEVSVCRFDELGDPDSREFRIGDGDWPFKGFVVRQGDDVFAYQNFCMHLGHPMNWKPDSFLTKDRTSIICSSHGAIYEIATGLCIGGPCIGKTLRTLPAEIRDGVIYVQGPVGK